MKVLAANKDGNSVGNRAYVGLATLVTLVALLMLASPALAKSSLSITLHFGDHGYYHDSSVYYGHSTYGYGPYVYSPYGHAYPSPYGYYSGHLKHPKHHKFGHHKHKFNRGHKFGHHKHKHFRGW